MIQKKPVREISAEEFASRCLELLDELAESGEELLVRRNGQEFVLARGRRWNRPSLKHMVTFMGDVESPIGDEWEAERDGSG